MSLKNKSESSSLPVTSAFQEIIAYRKRGEKSWVFDDVAKKLFVEPFVRGASELIDARLQIMERSRAEVIVIHFNNRPFTGYEFYLQRKNLKSVDGGVWYREPTSGLEAWLCANTLKFFSKFPEKIYARILA